SFIFKVAVVSGDVDRNEGDGVRSRLCDGDFAQVLSGGRTGCGGKECCRSSQCTSPSCATAGRMLPGRAGGGSGKCVARDTLAARIARMVSKDTTSPLSLQNEQYHAGEGASSRDIRLSRSRSVPCA